MDTTKNLKDYPIVDFIHKLSSKEPAPGGGGAAALTGAEGVALAAMVCNLTIGKKKYQEYEEDLKRILQQAISLQNRFMEMIEEDKINFIPLSKAYGIKAETPEEKIEKEKIMEGALKTACGVPIEIVERAFEGIRLHEELMTKGSKLAISDVGVGAEFLRAAIISGKMNVLINTGMMKDEEYKKKIEEHINHLVTQGVQTADKISATVMEML